MEMTVILGVAAPLQPGAQLLDVAGQGSIGYAGRRQHLNHSSNHPGGYGLFASRRPLYHDFHKGSLLGNCLIPGIFITFFLKSDRDLIK
jgi:hypothetical protein